MFLFQPVSLNIFIGILVKCAVETVGNIIDRDAELTLYFNLPDSPNMAEGFPRNSRTRMTIDFRHGQADLFAVQRFISDKLLGPDTVSSSQFGGGMAGHVDNGSGSLLAWVGDDNRMIDPVGEFLHSWLEIC